MPVFYEPLYALQSAGGGPASLYIINPNTGAGTLVGPTGFTRVSAMDFHPRTGILYALKTGDSSPTTDGVDLLRIDTITGKGTLIGRVKSDTPGITTDVATGMSFDPNGILYANIFFDSPIMSSLDTMNIFTINTSTAQATHIGSRSDIGSGEAIAINSSGQLFEMRGAFIASAAVIELSKTTGAALSSVPMVTPASPGPPFLSDFRYNGAAFNPTNGLLLGSVNTGFGGSPQNWIGTLNPLTGITSLLTPTVDSLDAFAWQPLSSAVRWKVVLRNFFLAQASITALVGQRIFCDDLYSLHESVQQFPMITITLDRGNSYLGLASTFDILINGHSNRTFFEAHEVLQTITDISDPMTDWLGSSFSLRGFSNPVEEYDIKSRVYTARKRFRVNLVGA
jgi:hypothetical protein